MQKQINREIEKLKNTEIVKQMQDVIYLIAKIIKRCKSVLINQIKQLETNYLYIIQLIMYFDLFLECQIRTVAYFKSMQNNNKMYMLNHIKNILFS